MTPGHSEIPTPHNDKDDESFLTVTIRQQRKWLILAASGLVIVAVVATVASTSSATDETSQSAAIRQPSPAPTTAPPKLLSYTDTKFDWLDIRNWQGDNEISATSFASSAFKPDRIHVSTFGRPFEKSPVLRTTPGWKGNRALLIEWTSYAGSDTNIWLLPTSLTSQFHTTAWPKCGEYDIFEMFNGDAAIGHKGTTNLWFNGGLEGFGQSTLHMSTTKCFAPFYPNGMNRPSSSSQSAQWHTAYGAKNAMAVVFGTDGNGKFIQQIQNPKIVLGPNSTVDIETDGANAAAKIYTNDNLYWGVKPVGGCADGYDGGSPGFPFMTDDFRLILQEQYQGTFDVTNFKVFVKN
ncbi:hypothetical protein DYB37_010131 [Aphanomyces astaci]|uniref:GH16 domain-containing protein n=1 Tax=Aphanomyces astaci TaxID=112090 RepID=A0A3R6WPC1_APHAT|nr:hypothetical protein DYB35_011039 [Aphanomyces astaci]RHZ34120.1 hypothetical protein DYB37_010131 [Aphanomyces astaci]